MRLAIDIYDADYKDIKALGYVPDEFSYAIAKAIRNGTVMPETFGAISSDIYFNERSTLSMENKKIGKWLKIKDNLGQHKIKCNCCNYIEPEYRTFSRNFCPNCGEKKVETQEIEENNG